MFRKYGFIGILLIVLVEVNFFLKIEPLATWYFPLVWYGYILVIDSLVYMLKKRSLISNRYRRFLGMVIISALFWYVFEVFNVSIKNWDYAGTAALGEWKEVFGFISFSTVLPAMFETVELIRALRLFERVKLDKKYRVTKRFLYSMMGIGVVCFAAPLFFPNYTFPLVWLSFFFILDPINYLHRQPSIVGHLKDRKLAIPLSLLVAGIVLGFLWEFWNYRAVIKWTYDVPFVGFFKLFEMPVLGYLGYFPFSFELYTMYWFVRSLFVHKEHLLSD